LGFDQKENVAWAKMRRAAEPELKIPPARFVDRLKLGLVIFPVGVP
jgi:hypothetical protein